MLRVLTYSESPVCLPYEQNGQLQMQPSLMVVLVLLMLMLILMLL
jgi:hypothetical protein